ncbi:MAG: nucleoside-diphosphate kinase [Lachnospiraceae bacterium]|nr:nucleoside-diphosphate kinase [Lachnospiraceae bacterium]
MERENVALMLIKHEGVQRNLIGNIIKRIENKGLKIIGMKMLKLSEKQVKELYVNCLHLHYFSEMLDYNSEKPMVAIVVEGPNGNICANEVCGKVGVPGTVRGDFAMTNSRNVLHCSDSEKSIEEIKMFFSEEELFEYSKAGDEWMM